MGLEKVSNRGGAGFSFVTDLVSEDTRGAHFGGGPPGTKKAGVKAGFLFKSLTKGLIHQSRLILWLTSMFWEINLQIQQPSSGLRSQLINVTRRPFLSTA